MPGRTYYPRTERGYLTLFELQNLIHTGRSYPPWKCCRV